MGTRRRSRELAMQVLFYMDMHQNDSDELLDLYCQNFTPSEKVFSFFLELVNGVIHTKTQIDSIIDRWLFVLGNENLSEVFPLIFGIISRASDINGWDFVDVFRRCESSLDYMGSNLFV